MGIQHVSGVVPLSGLIRFQISRGFLPVQLRGPFAIGEKPSIAAILERVHVPAKVGSRGPTRAWHQVCRLSLASRQFASILERVYKIANLQSNGGLPIDRGCRKNWVANCPYAACHGFIFLRFTCPANICLPAPMDGSRLCLTFTTR